MSIDAAAGTIEDKFRSALETDAGASPAGVPDPPPRIEDPDAPHGRAEDGTPNAPYGHRADGRPRIKPPGPGRGGKTDKPRVINALPPGQNAGSSPGPAPGPRDYTEALDEFAEGIWMLLSGTPVPFPGVRTRLHAQAAILRGNKTPLVKAWNTAAQHNEQIAAGVEKMTSGNAAWVLPVMFGMLPFVGQSIAMWRAPVAGDIQRLADHNRRAWDQMVAEAAAQMQAQEGAGHAAEAA